MSRLSLRLRLTLAFALVMAIVLAAVGAFLYVRLDRSLREGLDDGLEVRADTLAPLVRERGPGLDDGDLASGEDGFAQVLDAGGSVVAASPFLAPGPLLAEDELARAREGAYFLERERLAGLGDEPVRLLAGPVGDGASVLVVGASLEDRAEALDGLLAQLFVVGPLALLLSSAAGYLLAAAALRPVEAMREQAAEISSEEPGRRLPLPGARDEVHRLGTTLNAMLDRLEAGLARERRFVADAGHELRTPLALLQAELELALRRPRTAEELQAALRSAAEEVDRLARLAEDLLVLARLDEGRLPLRRTSLASKDLLEAVARRFAPVAAGQGRTLEVRADEDAWLSADRLRLEQALGNLVDNALRHGGGTVQLGARRRNGFVDLRVSDEGPGFPADVLPNAFERFVRADSARAGAASGLGLAIVEAIARAHGGSARVESDGGRTVVAIRLPA